MDQVRNPVSSQPAVAEPRDGSEITDDVLRWQQPLSLYHGGAIAPAQLAYRLAGRAGAPVVVALGGISAHRRIFDAREPRAGWWCEIAGPGRALDSERLRLLGIDYLGGGGESSAPQSGESFPSLSSYDQAEALRVLLDHLHIERLHGFVGASYGGMVGLAFAERYPERVAQLVIISAADRTHPLSTAWRSVQRRIVRFAASHGQPAEGVQLARALAMATYRSPDEFAARFAQPPRQEGGRFIFPIEDYLFARGRDYATRYRAECFLCLSESIDLHAVDATRIRVPTTLVAVREDQLVPLSDMRALAARLPRARLQELSSLHGHDAFLKEASALQGIFQPLYGDR
ncbi:MAG TPA: homoserine O-succinyltransferase [Steroidobacteraceae bacterium]|nr:homoserine O-succinyltransferase [Steroidobacteraceae bacterium]